MKNLKWLLIAFAMIASSPMSGQANSATSDIGIIINGTRWATRNVDTSGTFTRHPENFGRHFTWEQAQNACPRGWRLPTANELESLSSAGSAWGATRNGVNGRIFGVPPNQIFIPAAGWIGWNIALSDFVGVGGTYWSGTKHNDELVKALGFSDIGVLAGFGWTTGDKLSVRCVAITP